MPVIFLVNVMGSGAERTRLLAHLEMPPLALDLGAHGLFFNSQAFGPHAQPVKTPSIRDD